MKIKKALDRTFSLRPDALPPEEKVEWLNELDGQLYLETILTHENPDGIKFDRYRPEDLEAELLVPFPYDKVYISYLKMKIAEAYGETDEYNNAATIFNHNMDDFKAYWNKTHRPNSGNEKKTIHGGIYYIYPYNNALNRGEEE